MTELATPGPTDGAGGGPAEVDPTGTVLGGRYRVERLVGAGGMAQVWEGTDTVLGRKVAVKILHPHLAADEAFVKRFRQEAVAAARLSHPSIVAVYDTVADGRFEAIVLELLDATTLRRTLDAHAPLDADTTLRIALRMLDALEVAHRNGVVHRDVKPSNILLCRDGRVKIADFGIAKADDQTELTREGALVGTATYLAPEQLTDEPVDGRADLYSLGIVLYECLTGQVPFRGDTGAATALARLHSAPTDPRQLRVGIPDQLAVSVMRALERWPDDRFASAADFRAALLQRTTEPQGFEVPVGPVEPDDEPTMESETFRSSERSWLFPALGILLVAVAVAVAGLLVRRTTDEPAARPATTVPGAPATTAAPDDALVVDGVRTFDPDGTGATGENDTLAGSAVDGDPGTLWRTENYPAPDFPGDKDGVGLVVDLAGPAAVDTMTVESTDNGWSGKVFVLADGDLDALDPSADDPVADLDDVRTAVDVDLGGAEGRTVVLWITDLGEATPSGRHEVGVREVRLRGEPR